MNTSDRFLLHSIDAATRKADKNRCAASTSALYGFLAFMGVVIYVVLWADQAFV